MRKKKDTHGTPTYNKKYSNSTNYKSKSHHSILQRHEQRLKEFTKKTERLNKIDNQIKTIKRDIDKLKKENSFKVLNHEHTHDTSIEIEKLEKALQDNQSNRVLVESGDDMVKYMLDSSFLMMEYMELENREIELLNIQHHNDVITCELNEISRKKSELVDQYLSKFEDSYVGRKMLYDYESSICRACDERYEAQGGFLVCPKCGKCVKTIELHGELSYKELQEYDYRPQFTYDKMTHLEDWLRRFQAKENRTIPQEVLDKVLLEAKKERIKDLSVLTEDKVKRYLKKLDMNEYYDNVIGIINRINGRPPFTLTSEIENKIKSMFQQIQEPYEKHKPAGRKNFLSYSYTLHKFFQILNLHEFATYFSLLKSADKLRQQDDIFKKVVAEMAVKDKTIKWAFYPSI
jgi:hypothetical protein